MLEPRIKYLEPEIDARKLVGCNTVKISSNETFASIKEIWKAKEEAEKQAAYIARHGNTAAEDAPQDVLWAGFESLCGRLQL